jgi:hypothetical protein
LPRIFSRFNFAARVAEQFNSELEQFWRGLSGDSQWPNSVMKQGPSRRHRAGMNCRVALRAGLIPSIVCRSASIAVA